MSLAIPVSAKIRLGFDDKHLNFLEVITGLEKAGVDMIAIHARSAKQLYSGEPRFEMLKNLRSKMKVPLLISGNIFTLDDAIKAIEMTGADGVLLARGGVGNPFLLTQINRYYEDGVRLDNPSLKLQAEWCLKLAKEMIEDKGEEKAIRIYRSIAPKFFSGYPNSKELRLKLSSTINTYLDLESIVNNYLAEVSSTNDK